MDQVPKELFVSPFVFYSFRMFLSQSFGISTDESSNLIQRFTDSLVDFDSSALREEIVLAVRETFGEAMSRYDDADIVAWVTPYPKTTIGDLYQHCCTKIYHLDEVSPAWQMSEQKIGALGGNIISRVVRRMAGTDSWNIAYAAKKELDLDVSLETLVTFIEKRRKPKMLLEEAKLKAQLKLAFGKK